MLKKIAAVLAVSLFIIAGIIASSVSGETQKAAFQATPTPTPEKTPKPKKSPKASPSPTDTATPAPSPTMKG